MNGKIYCNDIEIPAKSAARVAKVDPRTVKHTLRCIEEDGELKPMFKYHLGFSTRSAPILV
jgi:predicted regulator of amino acid metabolism with ACT domain